MSDYVIHANLLPRPGTFAVRPAQSCGADRPRPLPRPGTTPAPFQAGLPEAAQRGAEPRGLGGWEVQEVRGEGGQGAPSRLVHH